MKFNDYLEKLRARPARERERIAVVATGISFVIILAIWLISFSEMNKSASSEADNVPVQDQLEELKKNAGESRQSIEEMMQGLPQDSMGLENLDSLNTGNQEMSTDNQNQDANKNQGNQLMPNQGQDGSAPPKTNSDQNDNQQEIPQLP